MGKEGIQAEAIRVVVADDHPIVCKALCELLAESPMFAVVAQAGDGEELLAKARLLCPDVVLLDFRIPGRPAPEIIQAIKSLPCSPRVLVVSAYLEVGYVTQALRAGADGYVLKTEPLSVFTDAVQAVFRGERAVSEEIKTYMLDHMITERPSDVGLYELTAREQDVLRLLSLGWDNVQIAEELGISPATVKNHVSSLYEKLGIHSRAGLVAFAWRSGYVLP